MHPNASASDTVRFLINLVDAGKLEPPARATALRATLHELAENTTTASFELTAADLYAGLRFVSLREASDDAVGARRRTCGELAGLLIPHCEGVEPGDARRWATVLRRWAFDCRELGDLRHLEIALTSEREANEIDAEFPGGLIARSIEP